jgi:hypothetical protein
MKHMHNTVYMVVFVMGFSACMYAMEDQFDDQAAQVEEGIMHRVERSKKAKSRKKQPKKQPKKQQRHTSARTESFVHDELAVHIESIMHLLSQEDSVITRLAIIGCAVRMRQEFIVRIKEILRAYGIDVKNNKNPWIITNLLFDRVLCDIYTPEEWAASHKRMQKFFGLTRQLTNAQISDGACYEKLKQAPGDMLLTIQEINNYNPPVRDRA